MDHLTRRRTGIILQTPKPCILEPFNWKTIRVLWLFFAKSKPEWATYSSLTGTKLHGYVVYCVLGRLQGFLASSSSSLPESNLILSLALLLFVMKEGHCGVGESELKIRIEFSSLTRIHAPAKVKRLSNTTSQCYKTFLEVFLISSLAETVRIGHFKWHKQF